MKTFNLEDALAGKPVVTRDGRDVTRLVHLPDVSVDNDRLIVVVENDWYAVTEEGVYYECGGNENDLFMKSEKRTGWINIYKDRHLRSCLGGIFETKEEATTYGEGKAIATIMIEWEECYTQHKNQLHSWNT